MNEATKTKAAVSVSEMARLCGLSRSQFYWHVERGTFHTPLRLASNDRPYYTAAMVEENLHARETGIGVNDEYVLFYERRPTDESTTGTKNEPKAKHAWLIDGLKSLGLSTITPQAVNDAFETCFPKGAENRDEATVLRTVFVYLKRRS